MKYYKINLGYSQFVPIDETELVKVIKAQVNNGVVYLKNGMVNTRHISSIVPDYNRAMGWNESYKPEGEDFALMSATCKDYGSFLEKISQTITGNHNVEVRKIENK